MYQDYKFKRNNRNYLKNNGDGSRDLSYRCSESDRQGCKAYLRVNMAGDVLAAFIEHNHIANPDEELEMGVKEEPESAPGKLRCTKRQIQYLINFMLKNKDLATGVRNAENRNKKWLTLAFNLATIGPWKPIKHLKATWRDLRKGSRTEIVRLVSHAKGADKCVPTERTCKVFEALGHPIPENVGPKELSDILAKSKPSGSEKLLSNLLKHKILPNKAKPRYVKQSHKSDSKKDRCTKRQKTFLIDYMVQNKELALGNLEGSVSHKKWQELEFKMAAIGPWKSAKHLMGTWRELQMYARKKSIVAPGEEQPKANTMKVINLMELPVVFLAPGETAADHDYADDSHVGPTYSAVDTGDSDDDSDSSSNWPIYEVDSYP